MNLMCRKANREPEKFSPLLKMAENLLYASNHLKGEKLNDQGNNSDKEILAHICTGEGVAVSGNS